VSGNVETEALIRNPRRERVEDVVIDDGRKVFWTILAVAAAVAAVARAGVEEMAYIGREGSRGKGGIREDDFGAKLCGMERRETVIYIYIEREVNFIFLKEYLFIIYLKRKKRKQWV
jgi:hypothetical protein